MEYNEATLDNNPFRYCGEYYDKETQNIYLRARYYNVAQGRFTQEDPIRDGYNWYAYCGGNPVNFIDRTGLSFTKMINITGKSLIEESLGLSGGGGRTPKIIQDIENFDWDNESESKTLESNYFSCYKDVLVFRTDGERSGSFGCIFLTRESNSRQHPEDVVRHEYGHIKQMERVGCINYLFGIFIPSSCEWGKGSYYDKPWEVTADVYGNVQYEEHNQEDIQKGFKYLGVVEKYGVLSWFLIE